MSWTLLDDADSIRPPAVFAAIAAETQAMGFTMASTMRTGVMLRAFAASKPGGRILELGTGTGVGTAWLIDGMSTTSTLDTVDNDQPRVAVARRHLGHDPRVRFHVQDGLAFLRAQPAAGFDLIFADTWPGKFDDLNTALSLLAPGGLYVIDDLLPQPAWPADHAPKIPRLLDQLASRTDLILWPLNWDTGIVVAAKKA